MDHQRKISVVGLGYVGLPVAVAFGKQQKVVGFDINPARIEELDSGYDRTHEVDASELVEADVVYTSDPTHLGAADFYIVTVPTPIDTSKQPDLGPLLHASELIGRQLKTGDIVVFESTVYPGATEEQCVPVLEQTSGLKSGLDFAVGYSPERINPGDRAHSFTNIAKVVSGQNEETLEVVAQVYESVVTAPIHRAPSIQVAEAAKVIENTQRDLNIALMNELALIFSRLGIDTRDVLAAAGTKWNFLPFTPGLVGGHCIGVDPFYLTHKATLTGYYPQVILAGRRINDGMGAFIANQAIKHLIQRGQNVKGSIVTVLGLAFKEDVPDLRNTRVIDIVRELMDYGVEVQVHDPVVDPKDAMAEFNILIKDFTVLKPAHCVVLAVAHTQYVKEGWRLVTELLQHQRGVAVDVKGILPRCRAPQDVSLFRL